MDGSAQPYGSHTHTAATAAIDQTPYEIPRPASNIPTFEVSQQMLPLPAQQPIQLIQPLQSASYGNQVQNNGGISLQSNLPLFSTSNVYDRSLVSILHSNMTEVFMTRTASK
jgi:hypothetical protein